MSATLVAKGLAAGFGERVLFSGLDLVVAPGDVTGLVGVNGAGKSTLLRVLAGITTPDEGTVRLSPPSANVGYLPQERDRRPGETVRGFLGRRTGVTAAQAELDAATAALAEGATDADEAYAVALERWLALGGADLDERVAEVVADLGLQVGLDAAMTSLSGGQAARAGMASLLLSRFDVFLLDEPTNDLDLDGLDRLETFVAGLRAATVLVSHDREFLARTVTEPPRPASHRTARVGTRRLPGHPAPRHPRPAHARRRPHHQASPRHERHRHRNLNPGTSASFEDFSAHPRRRMGFRILESAKPQQARNRRIPRRSRHFEAVADVAGSRATALDQALGNCPAKG